jgi:hypothetical protein
MGRFIQSQRESSLGASLVGLFACIIAATLVAAAVCGWCLNVYKLTQCDFEAPYKAEVIRGIGVPFGPVGIFAGYLDIEDGENHDE